MSDRPSFAQYDRPKLHAVEGLATLSDEELSELVAKREQAYRALAGHLPQLVEHVTPSPVEVYGRAPYSGYDELLRVARGWPVGDVSIQHRESSIRVSHLMMGHLVVTEDGFFGIARMSQRGDAYVLNDPRELTRDNVVNYQRVPSGDVEPGLIIPPADYISKNVAALFTAAGLEYTPPITE
jgi:hypothetical protein